MAKRLLSKYTCSDIKTGGYLCWLELIAVSIASPYEYAEVVQQVRNKGAELIHITSDTLRARLDGDHAEINEKGEELEREGWQWAIL